MKEEISLAEVGLNKCHWNTLGFPPSEPRGGDPEPGAATDGFSFPGGEVAGASGGREQQMVLRSR